MRLGRGTVVPRGRVVDPRLIAEPIEADKDPMVGDLDHHYELMFEYERKTVQLQHAVQRYTEGLKAKYRQLYPERDEKSIKAMALKDTVRVGLIGDQQWFERMTIREATIVNTIINRRRFEIEFGDFPPANVTTLEVVKRNAA